MNAREGLDATLARLSASAFRRRFHLDRRDRTYLDAKGRTQIVEHARDFVAERLSPAQPRSDGQQTPMRGHPVFVAQHATATCCRGCLAKWHGIAAGRPLTVAEQEFAVALIARWLDREAERPAPGAEGTSRRQAKVKRKASPSTRAADDAQHDLFSPDTDAGEPTS